MKKRLLVVAATLLVGVVGVGVAGWYFFVRGDPAPRAAIVQTKVMKGGTLDGVWTVATGAAGSFVGYRVQEKFAFAALESTATARTSTVQGSLAVNGATVRSVTITADLRTLQSDQPMRDHQIHSVGLESSRFPQATFVITRPIRLPATPAAGVTAQGDAVGHLTLHGVTRAVALPVKGRWDGTRVQLVGHLPIVFADYGMRAPSIGGFVSVSDRGELEFQLFLTKS